MKVISGTLKGRKVKGFTTEGTRPTMDRVKESLFAMIQDYLEDSIILDLFAGSGNLGIEGISNGAKESYFVDKNKVCIEIIYENLDNLNIENGHILNYDYKKALEYFKNNKIKFDLIFLDPPYKFKIINEIIDYVLNNDLLTEKGLIVCETEETLNINYDDLKLLKSKEYGDTHISVYRR